MIPEIGEGILQNSTRDNKRSSGAYRRRVRSSWLVRRTYKVFWHEIRQTLLEGLQKIRGRVPITPPPHIEVKYNILQNLFQHSKALLQAEENPCSLLERAKDGFNQAPLSEALVSESNTQALQSIPVPWPFVKNDLFNLAYLQNLF
ncbi:MAG: hypothetical protein ACXQS7_03805 [Candidatus Syntropharchaeia archaeon]